MGLSNSSQYNKDKNKKSNMWEKQTESLLPKKQTIILTINSTKHSFPHQTASLTQNKENKQLSEKYSYLKS